MEQNSTSTISQEAARNMLAALRLCLPVIEKLAPYEHNYEREAEQAARAAIDRAMRDIQP